MYFSPNCSKRGKRPQLLKVQGTGVDTGPGSSSDVGAAAELHSDVEVCAAITSSTSSASIQVPTNSATSPSSDAACEDIIETFMKELYELADGYSAAPADADDSAVLSVAKSVPVQ